MSTSATMALTLAVDRAASIEVLKNIQSLAFGVQVRDEGRGGIDNCTLFMAINFTIDWQCRWFSNNGSIDFNAKLSFYFDSIYRRDTWS